MYERQILGYKDATVALEAIHGYVMHQLAEGKEETAVSVAVVDAYGEIIAVMRMDGCTSLNVAMAVKKARIAALTRRHTREVNEIMHENSWTVTQVGDYATQIPGGLCITKPGGDRISKPGMMRTTVEGAIGISGRLSDEDEEIAFIGLRALQEAVWGKGD